MGTHNVANWRKRKVRLRQKILTGLAFVAGLAGLAGCGDLTQINQPELAACSRQVIALAEGHYDTAKEELAEYFRLRTDGTLLKAYYSSRESSITARRTSRCADFSPSYRNRARELIMANAMLQKVVVVNMRDPDPWILTGIYGESYRDIFKKDIY